MANLLSKAAKISFEDSTVNVEIKHNSDRVCVAVTDQGPVFLRISRINSSTNLVEPSIRMIANMRAPGWV